MGAVAIPVLVEAGIALGTGAAMLYEWVASGKDQRLGRKVADDVDCHFTPDCYSSANPYLAEARRRAAVEDLVMQLKKAGIPFAPNSPLHKGPVNAPTGASPTSGGNPWGSVGLAAAAVGAGLAVYNVITGDPESAPYSVPYAPATPELDAAEEGCLGPLQRARDEILRTLGASGANGGLARRLEAQLVSLRALFQHLRNRGIPCPGANNFGQGPMGEVGCNTLLDFAHGFGPNADREDAIQRLLVSDRPEYAYPQAMLTFEEWTALNNQPSTFHSALEKFVKRICAPGALSASAPAASTP